VKFSARLAAALAAAASSAVIVATLPASGAEGSPALPPVDASQHLRIMPLGDSITAGVNSPTGDGYRDELYQFLVPVQQLYRTDYVGSQTSGTGADRNHEGHSGWRIDQLMPLVPGWMATYQPDIVLLDIGTNDARQGATADVMAQRMGGLLDAVLAAAPSVRIVVGDLVPNRYGTYSDTASVEQQRFNRLLPSIVSAAGPRVTLAHVSAAVTSGQLTDGVHPGQVGYRYMAWVWWRCMAPLLVADGATRWGLDPLPVPVPDDRLCSN
jgi:lysophospholipase L1-like esterase